MRCAAVLLLLASSAVAWAQPAKPRAANSAASAEPLFIEALAALYRGDPQEAATQLADVLALVPDDAAVLDALAEAYQKQGLVSDALYHAEAAATLAPDEAMFQRRLAELYAAAGDAGRAQQARDTAERLAPTWAPAAPVPPPRVTKRPAAAEAGDLPGEAAYRDGRYAEAAEALLSVVEADPRRLDAWPLALDASAKSNDTRGADAARLAVLLYPTVPTVVVAAAEALLAFGRTDEARSASESALRALDAGTDNSDLRARARAVLSSLD